jgi:hypothetical protein
MNEEITSRLAALETKVSVLEAQNKKIIDDVCHYIDQHGDIHHELDRMTYKSFFKTHPEYSEAMDRYHDIMEGKIPPPAADKT